MVTLIKDFKDNETIYQQFVISSITKSTSTSGKPYVRLTLKDISGTITGVKWNVEDEELRLCENGNIVLINGVLETYKNNLQVNINFIAPVKENEIEQFRFVKSAPLSKDELYQQLNYYLDLIKNETLHTITSELIKDNLSAFLTYPAAISVHHDFEGGLAYHTLSMAKIGEFLSSQYKFIDKDLLISGILLHDIGKTIEFEGDIAYRYSLKGKLLGHISIMSSMIENKAKELHLENDEKIVLLEHLILSHHGEYEFGSPILPQTAEAILLNLIDNVDSKMEIVNKALNDTQKGEYTAKIFALDNRILYKE